jgi:hypothetical protein
LTWIALSEATRRGARVAVVCPLYDPAIKNIAMFDSPTGENGGLIAGLSADHIDLAYLDSAGTILLDPVADYIDIEFVRVSINDGYSFSAVLPWLSSIVNAPPFRTTLPRESLGVSRESVDACIV